MEEDFKQSDFKKPTTDKSKVSWGPLAAIVGSFLTLLTATVVAALTFPKLSEDNVSVVYKFVAEVAYSALLVAAIVGLVKISGGYIKDLGFKKFKKPKADLIKVGKAFLYYLGISLILFSLLNYLVPEDILKANQDLGYDPAVGGLNLVLVAVMLIVVVPIAEETLFRGYLFKGLRKALSFWPAALIASGLFGLAHGQLNVAIDVTIMAVAACWLLERTGSIYSAMLIHALKNSIAFLLVFIVQLN